jgi:hypothetical protein
MNDMANQEAVKEASRTLGSISEAGGQGGEAMGLTYGSGNDKLRYERFIIESLEFRVQVLGFRV